MGAVKSSAPEVAAEVVEVPREVDRVALVSLRADGTPDQGEGFEVLPES